MVSKAHKVLLATKAVTVLQVETVPLSQVIKVPMAFQAEMVTQDYPAEMGSLVIQVTQVSAVLKVMSVPTETQVLTDSLVYKVTKVLKVLKVLEDLLVRTVNQAFQALKVHPALQVLQVNEVLQVLTELMVP